jgi:hypothetical protein
VGSLPAFCEVPEDIALRKGFSTAVSGLMHYASKLTTPLTMLADEVMPPPPGSESVRLSLTPFTLVLLKLEEEPAPPASLSMFAFSSVWNFFDFMLSNFIVMHCFVKKQ